MGSWVLRGAHGSGLLLALASLLVTAPALTTPALAADPEGSVRMGDPSGSLSGASATSVGAIAIGGAVASTAPEAPGASASAEFAVAIGSGSIASGTAAMALGAGAQSAGESSVALGFSALAQGDGSTAIGNGSFAAKDANDLYAGTAIGAGARAEAGGVAIGNSAVASDPGTAIGTLADASGTDAVAVGFNATAQGTNAVALGARSVANGSNAIALGADASTGGFDDAIALGANAQALANGAMAFGANSRCDQAGSTALGAGATCTAPDQIVLGNATTQVVVPGALSLNGITNTGALTTTGDAAIGGELTVSGNTRLSGPQITIGAANGSSVVSIPGLATNGESRFVTANDTGTLGTSSYTINQYNNALQMVSNQIASVGAMAAALSALPNLTTGNKNHACGIGSGAFGSSWAFATGCVGRLGQNVWVNGALSFTPSITTAFGATPSMGGRLGVFFQF